MGWSAKFLRALEGEQALAPVFLLSVVGEDEGLADSPGTATTLASHPGYDAPVVLGLPTLPSSRVSLNSWSYTIGEWMVPIVASEEWADDLVDRFPRGTVVALRMGFQGWTEDEFQTVAIGQVRDLSGPGPEFLLLLRELQGGLITRITTSVDQYRLFYNAGDLATLDSPYTVTDTTLTTSNGAAFELDEGGSGQGLVKVAGPTQDFYLTYTGVAGNDLTGVSVAAVYGTTAEDVPTTPVLLTNMVLLQGHPATILKRLLCSTGTLGDHGPNDDYPKSWAYGLPEFLWDSADISRWKNEVMAVATGTYQWDVILDAPVDNGWSWLSGLLSSAGAWVVSRQGQLSLRAIQDPDAFDLVETDYPVTDEWIVSLDAISRWDPELATPYHRVQCLTEGSSRSDSTGWSRGLKGVPIQGTLAYDLSAVVWTNQSEVEAEVLERVRLWAASVCERATLTLRGLHWWALAPGDVIPVTTDRIKGGRFPGITRTGDSLRPEGGWDAYATVLAVTPNLASWTTTLEVVVNAADDLTWVEV